MDGKLLGGIKLLLYILQELEGKLKPLLISLLLFCCSDYALRSVLCSSIPVPRFGV